MEQTNNQEEPKRQLSSAELKELTKNRKEKIRLFNEHADLLRAQLVYEELSTLVYEERFKRAKIDYQLASMFSPEPEEKEGETGAKVIPINQQSNNTNPQTKN